MDLDLYQSVSPDKDRFIDGLVRVRVYKNLLEEGDTFLNSKYNFKGELDTKLFFWGSSVFAIRFWNNLITIRSLSKWTVTKNIKELERAIQFIISVIYTRDPPSRANASNYTIYYYTNECKSIPCFNLLHSSIDDTIIGERISDCSEHSMNLYFDNNYNTPYIKGPDFQRLKVPKWRDENINWRPVLQSFQPKGLSF